MVMGTSSATPPATRRIARSYLTDLVAATPLARGQAGPVAHSLIAPVVEQLLGRAVQVRHVLRSDQLVLTFDLADDPTAWATAEPATTGQPENRDYPGQPGERAPRPPPEAP